MYGYCRLSRDEDKENYASIEEQKRIIQDFATSRNWTISDFYIDDNVSGYTFNRPAFSKMIEKVKGGKIDVVIAKDLSRIGRHNGRVLVLIDEFKNIQKNLILVSEMGGTYDVLNDRDDTIGITTWFNNYFNVYLWTSIIASVISLFNIGNLKNEANQSQNNLSWDEYLEKNFPSQGTKANFSDIRFKDNDQSEK